MAQHSTSGRVIYRDERAIPATVAETPAARQAYAVLHWAFVAIPAIVGIDKFFHVITNWDQYFAPQLARLSPLNPHLTMRLSGIVEIAAALLVAVVPQVGAWIVAAWLGGIIVDLALLGDNWDIVLRDAGLMLAAIALARLSVAHRHTAQPAKVE